MKLRLFASYLALSLVGSLLIAPLSASAQTAAMASSETAKSASFPVTGKGTSGSGAVTFAGTFNVQRFRVEDGHLFAVGTLSGTVTQTANSATTEVPAREVKLPVQSINGKPVPTGGDGDDGDGDMGAMMEMAQAPSCNILNLVLGPLHLNLLGLVVDLNEVVLNITGQTGPGNLLGNLLCAIAGLLDQTGTLSVLTNLLNALVDLRRLGLV